jgi:hypothetical protein
VVIPGWRGIPAWGLISAEVTPTPDPTFQNPGADHSWWGQLVTVLLGGSGAALITTMVWAFQTVRRGAQQRNRRLLEDLEDARDAAETRATRLMADNT